MFALRRHGDVSLRYYGGDHGILGHRDGGRIGLQGEFLRVVQQLESAAGLKTLLALPAADLCPPELEPARKLVAGLLERLAARPPESHSKLLRAVPGLYELALAERIPLFAMVEITYRCNLRCRHCYILSKVDRPRPETMGADQALALLDALADRGCLDVTLTGGETTLHPAWPRLLRRAKDLGFFTMLKTNGLTFTPENVARYAEDPAHSTHLSLYGATAESHEGLTGRPGSYARTVAALRELARLGVPCKVFCLVWKGNLDEVEAMRALVEDLGHTPVVSATIFGRLDGDRAPRDLRIAPADHERLVDRGLVPPFEVAPCTAGRTKMKIEPSGRIATCELLAPTFGEAGTPSLQGWNDPRLVAFGDRMIAVSCAETENGYPVLSCPGVNLLNTGSVRGTTTFET